MSESLGRVAGKVAIVTGASSGMGVEHAKLLVAEGASVVLADVSDAAGRTLAESLGAKALYQHLDVSKPEEWEAVVAAANSAFGPVDVLVNNAGIGAQAEFDDETLDSFRRVLEVDLIGVFNGMKAVSLGMKKLGHGSIVNISSIAGMKGWWLSHGYTASKYAVRGLTKSVALDLGPYGIRVNSVHPGIIKTPAAAALGATFLNDHIALRRAGSPEEIAKLVLFLASDESSFSTGAEFLADGGETAGYLGPVFEGQPGFSKIEY